MNETTDAPEELLTELAALATAVAASGKDVVPERVLVLAAMAVPSADHGGFTLLRDDRPPRTLAASDDQVEAVDTLQYRLREGPCLDAATGPPVVMADDLEADSRWPRFGPECVRENGIRSMLSLRLPVGGSDHAAVNFYSGQAGTFADGDVTAAAVLVPLAALAVETELRRQDRSNLLEALRSSRQVSTAVGILMATHRVDSDTAFALLRRASMNLNQKLRDVADEVTHTGELPDGP